MYDFNFNLSDRLRITVVDDTSEAESVSRTMTLKV